MAFSSHLSSLGQQPYVDLSRARLTCATTSCLAQIDDSGVFSDDTGFFSSPEDVGNSLLRAESPLHLPRPAQTISKEEYDELLKKYLALKLGSSFSLIAAVDFNELIQVLKMTTTFSGLNITAQILELALNVWSLSVMECLRCAKSIAADCRRRERSNKHSESEKMTAVVATGVSELSSSPVLKASDRDCTDDQCDRARTVSRNVHLRKTLVIDNNQLSSTFGDSVSDVVHRRKMLAAKFHGLANETLLDCEFNIHDVYQSEASTIFRNCIPTLSETGLLAKMIHCSGGVPKIQEMFLPIFTSLSPLQNSESDKFSEMEINLTQEEHLPQENIEPPDALSESENQALLKDLILSENIDTVITASEQQKQILTNSTNGANKVKFQRRKRSARVPLEPLNPRDSVPNSQNDEELSNGAKRMMLDDSGIYLTDDDNYDLNVEHGQQEKGNCTQLSSQSELLVENQDAALDQNISISGFNIPPIIDDGDDNEIILNKSVRHKLVDMKALINNFDRVVLNETNDKQPSESTFVEVVTKSKIRISARSSVFEDNRTEDNTTVSVGVAFLACLHLASKNRMYLVEAEDTIFNITKSRPDDPLLSSLHS